MINYAFLFKISLIAEIKNGYQLSFYDTIYGTYTLKLDRQMTDTHGLNKVSNDTCWVDPNYVNERLHQFPFVCGNETRYENLYLMKLDEKGMKFNKVFDQKRFQMQALDKCGVLISSLDSFSFTTGEIGYPQEYKVQGFKKHRNSPSEYYSDFKFIVNLNNGTTRLECGVNPRP